MSSTSGDTQHESYSSSFVRRSSSRLAPNNIHRNESSNASPSTLIDHRIQDNQEHNASELQTSLQGGGAHVVPFRELASESSNPNSHSTPQLLDTANSNFINNNNSDTSANIASSSSRISREQVATLEYRTSIDRVREEEFTCAIHFLKKAFLNLCSINLMFERMKTVVENREFFRILIDRNVVLTTTRTTVKNMH
jgi:hypothetical protein